MAEVRLGDLVLHYEDEGSGPALLLLAGMASDSASWGPLVPLLSNDFRLLRPDNRGAGRTRTEDAPISVPLCAGDAAALLDHLGTGPVQVVGHSMGGMIALELAATRPDLVAGLTLLATAPQRHARNQHMLETLVRLRAPGMAPDLWLRAFYPWLFQPGFFRIQGAVDVALKAALAYPHAQSAERFAAQVAALAPYDPSGLPARIRCKVQAVLGGQDLLYPLASATEALETAFPDLRTTVLAEAAHSIHWDAPEAVATAIRAFARATPATVGRAQDHEAPR